jgi:hypothetical protein
MTYHGASVVAALLAVAVFYLFLELLPGKASYQYLFLHWIFISAAAAAFSSCFLVQRIGWWPRANSVLKTGALRGGVIALAAHPLFGVYFMACAALESTFEYRSEAFSIWGTVFSSLLISFSSLMALPATLIAGCLSGMYAERKV